MFTTLIEQVEERSARGVPFGEIEDEIGAMPVSDPERDALWLLAWSLRDREQATMDAKLHLAMVCD